MRKPNARRLVFDALLTAVQPAHVQKTADGKLQPQELDARRSEIIRSAIDGGM